MPSVAGKRVLIFGDSLSSGPNSPGAQLAAHLQASGATTQINAVVGRSAWNFFTTREDSAAVIGDCNAFAADIAIVELGTNDIGMSQTADRAAMIQIRDALSRSGRAQVWAIGPPSFASGTAQAKGVDGVVAMMKGVFGKKFVDWRPLSRDMTSSPPRTADQIHFTTAGGQLAGARLGEAFLGAGGGIGIVTLVVAAALAWAILR